MKKIMHSKGFLHRVTAFAMAVVMVLTLVLVDSNVHLFAEEEPDDVYSIDISSFFLTGEDVGKVTSISTWTNKDSVLLMLDEEKLPEGTMVSEDDLKYVVSEEPGTATPSDAVKSDDAKLTDLGIKKSFGEETADGSVLELDVYMKLEETTEAEAAEEQTDTPVAELPLVLASAFPEEDTPDTYKLVGTVTVSLDKTAPTVGASVSTASSSDDNGVYNYKQKISEDESTYYLVNTDAFIDISVTLEDAGSGVKTVEYKLSTAVDADAAPIAPQADGTYKLTIDDKMPSGTYQFRATDAAGNTCEWSGGISIKRLDSKPSITSVTPSVSEKNDIKFYLGGLQEVSGTDTVTYNVSVATQKAGDVDVDSYVKYMLVTDNGVGREQEAKVSEGNASFMLSANNISKKTKTNLVMRVVDDLGNSSYYQDENGHILFLKKGAPTVTIDTIKLGTGTYSLNDYKDLENKWTKSLSFTVKAENNYSYLDKLSYKCGESEGKLQEKINAYDVSSSVTVGTDGSTIVLGDGETGISFTATDFDDKTGTGEITAYIDNTKPVIGVSSSSKGDVADGYEVGADETLTVSYSDATSGIASAKAKLTRTNGDTSVVVYGDESGNAKEIENNAELSLTETGDYNLTVTVTDKAGNEETYTSGTIIVDKTVIAGNLEVKSSGSDITGGLSYCNNDVTIKYWVDGYKLDESCVDVSISAKAFDDKVSSVGDKAVKGKVENIDGKAGINRVTVTYTVSAADIEGRYDISITANKKYAASDSTSETKTAAFYYDRTAPATISISMVDGTEVHGVRYYTADTAPVIRLTATENSGSNGDAGNSLTYEIVETGGSTVDSGSFAIGAQSIAKDITTDKCSADRIYEVKVKLTDKAGNTGDSLMSVKFMIDTTTPTLRINNDTNGRQNTYWNRSDVTITADAADNSGYISRLVVTGTCDGQDIYGAAGKTITVSEAVKVSGVVIDKYSKEGVYRLSVIAYDEVGNPSAPAVTTFVIDKTSPEVSVSGGDVYNLGDGKRITFTISDEYGINEDGSRPQLKVHYRSYDQSIWTTESLSFGGSGKSVSVYYDMTARNGKATEYYFELAGTDNSGNAVVEKSGEALLSSALRTVGNYYVDKTNPIVLISDNPANVYSDHAYFNKAVTFGVSVTEQFSVLAHTFAIDNSNGNVSSANSSESFVIPADGGTWSKSYTYSAEGEYNLALTATDACGNNKGAAVAGTHFYIDLTKPVITLDPNGTVAGTVNNSDVTLPVVLTDNMRGYRYSVYVERRDSSGTVVENGYRIEDASWGTSGSGISTVTDIPSITFGDEGDYTVTVTAVDRAGNEADAKAVRFRIDKTAPVISISGMNDTQTSAVTALISVNEAYSLSFEGRSLGSSDISVNVTRKTDGTAASNVLTLGTGSFSGGNPHTTSYSFSEDGEYTITVTARDLSGNVAAAATKTFKIDSNAPVITASAVDKDGKTVNINDVVGSISESAANYVDMSLSIEEAFFATNNVKITVMKDGKDVSGSYFTGYSNSAEVSTGRQRFDEDGVYNITVTAVDALGNEAESYNIVFTVDNVAPSITPTSKLKGFLSKDSIGEDGSVLLNAEDFADILNKGYEALWDVTDTSVFDVKVKMDGVDLIDFSDMTDGYHRIEIEVTDQVGHVTTDEFEFTYDGTAPRIIITGVEDGETVREPFTMTIGLEDEADEITSIIINGSEIDPSEYADGTYEMAVEEYDTYVIEVSAKDKAGNVASTFNEDTESYFTFTLREKMSPVMIIVLIAVVILLIGLLVFIIMAGKRKRQKKAA